MTQDDIEADKLCHQLSVGVLRQGQGDTARVRYGGQAMMRLRRASVIGFSLLTSARDGICRLRVGVVAAARGNIAKRVGVFVGLDLAHCRSYIDGS